MHNAQCRIRGVVRPQASVTMNGIFLSRAQEWDRMTDLWAGQVRELVTKVVGEHALHCTQSCWSPKSFDLVGAGAASVLNPSKALCKWLARLRTPAR